MSSSLYLHAKAARYPPMKCSHEIIQLGMNIIFFSFLNAQASREVTSVCVCVCVCLCVFFSQLALES